MLSGSLPICLAMVGPAEWLEHDREDKTLDPTSPLLPNTMKQCPSGLDKAVISMNVLEF
jgi:hypothetical protein